MTLSISIVTPSYNQGRFIGTTIESVLEQNIAGLDYVVCDGGSTDGTLAVLRAHETHLRWTSEPDHGQADAVNKGIRGSRSDIIGWLNSDDIYYPGALETVLAFFESHPDASVVYGDADHIDECGRVIESYYTEDWNYEHLKDVCFICQPSVFFRRRVVEQYGLLDPTLHYCMDYEYWLRVGAHTPFVRLPQTLAGSRMYPDNKTLRARAAVHEEINEMLARALGKTPTRWIYNYAFAVVDSQGYDRARPDQYVWSLIRSTTRAFLRWRRYIPPAVMLTMLMWTVRSFRTGRGLEIPK